MPKCNREASHTHIIEKIMKNKTCTFELCKVSSLDVKKKLLLSINSYKPSGSDNIDGKL